MPISRLALVAICLCGAASARADDLPPFRAGTQDLTFEQSAPESSADEMRRRTGIAEESDGNYDLLRERFRAIVPATYRHAKPWGLIVWIDPSPTPMIPREWLAVLARKKILFISAYESGNARSTADRLRLAIDAAHNMKARFRIDPARVWVAGLSGGGRVASILGVSHADVFSGAFPMVGANFYKPVPTGEADKAWRPSYRPDPEILAAAKVKNRYVLLTGEKDFNRENVLRTAKAGFEAEGFRHVRAINVPRMGHELPSAASLAKGLDFLDGKEPPR